MNNNMRQLIEKLKATGITTSQIIEKSGVGRSQFYATLNGVSIPRLDTANKICKVLKADIDDVFPELKREKELR